MKGPGLDGISAKIKKSAYLTHTLNVAFITGGYADDLILDRITPV